jgi:uncharacterized protein YcbX
VGKIELDTHGVKRDRRFMVVDEKGRWISQRTEPSMCRICVEVRLDGSVSLSLAGQPNAAQCCFKPVSVASATNPQVEVVVWADDVIVVDQGDAVAAWFSDVLGRPARLVGMTPSFDRPTSVRSDIFNKNVQSKRSARGVPVQTSFTDRFPLLVASEESLQDLNSRMSTPLPMNRFRPNIVFKGCNAFDEDKWRTVVIGDLAKDRYRAKLLIFHFVRPSSRCKITTTDQETGHRGKEHDASDDWIRGSQKCEPLATLSTYRQRRHIKAPCGDKVDVFFGQVPHTPVAAGLIH